MTEFKPGDSNNYWDESKHIDRNSVSHNVTEYSSGSACAAVLLLINIVQNMQPRWVERPPEKPDTVMVELPRDVARRLRISGPWSGDLMTQAAEACRAALDRDGEA